MITLSEVQSSLWIAGALSEKERARSASLTTLERKMILSAREKAQEFGLSRQMINRLEDEGAKEIRGYKLADC